MRNAVMTRQNSHKEMTTKIHFLRKPSVQTFVTNFSIFHCSVCFLNSSHVFFTIFIQKCIDRKKYNSIFLQSFDFDFLLRVSIFFRSI